MHLDPRFDKTKNKLMQKLIDEDHLKITKLREREYSHHWAAISSKIYGGSIHEAKANVILASYDGANRLARR